MTLWAWIAAIVCTFLAVALFIDSYYVHKEINELIKLLKKYKGED